MRFRISIFLTIFFLFAACKKQNSDYREIKFKRFNWTLNIPKSFEAVSKQDWEKHQNRGTQAIENTLGETIENNSKIIFIFKKSNLNIFEASFQPFDESIDGNHSDSFDMVNEILTETFNNQIPDIIIDEERSVEMIDGLKFQVNKIKLTYPNNTKFYNEMHSTLIGKEELTVNIMYTDEKLGEIMRESFLSSKFGNN
ncbi:hypothetical protein [Moheibacter sediminis]|uniref:Uncharacterized protein n=1 Tax=Moheibacter sediminis TaxID=1434700 RepID=A0A1W2B0L8_9FLAO|nr:hypothetical protein [Moheibacter sediminis]SMC66262.1 hypothetical protein SAMN06296427_105194 [Moheibacter sediminis]